MFWKPAVLYLVLALSSTQLCRGQVVDSEAAVQRPSSGGSVDSRRVKHAAAGQTRPGSLTFNFDGQTDQRSAAVLHKLMDAQLKRMDPSVRCGDNLMTLKVKGPRAPHFLVDSGEGPPTPLSRMPSECGFSVKRSRRDVHFSAPYQGCHVAQQGDHYVLPLNLWGAPLTMSCPAVLPQPTVSCFPSGMVVHIGGTIPEPKVKVSGMWKPLSSVCSSCGFGVEMLPEGVRLTVPYNRGQCIQTEDNKHFLSLLLTDVEHLITCSLLLDVNPTTTTTTTAPLADNPQIALYPHFMAPLPQQPQISQQQPQMPPQHPPQMPPQHPPQMPPQQPPQQQQPQMPPQHPPQQPPQQQQPQMPPQQQPQQPLMPSGSATDSQSQKAPVVWPVPSQDAPAPPPQLTLMAQSLGYPYYLPQFSMYPGNLNPTAPPPPATTPAPPSKHDGNIPQQPQFLMPPQYFLQFANLPPLTAGQTPIQQPKPHPHTHPVLHAPHKYPSQKPNSPTASPTATAATPKPAAQNQFYYPLSYFMPEYYARHQAPMLVFPDPATMSHANPAPFNQHGPQGFYHGMPHFYPFPTDQKPKSFGRH